MSDKTVSQATTDAINEALRADTVEQAFDRWMRQYVVRRVEEAAATAIGARRHPNGEMRADPGTPAYYLLEADRNNWRNRYLLAIDARKDDILREDAIAQKIALLENVNDNLNALNEQQRDEILDLKTQVRSLRGKLSYWKGKAK